ncbi:6206_t:CDS:1, partial [Cetraspora pellucida]
IQDKKNVVQRLLIFESNWGGAIGKEMDNIFKMDANMGKSTEERCPI